MSKIPVQGRSGRTVEVTAAAAMTAGNLHALRTGTSGWCGVVEKTAAIGEKTLVSVGHHVKVPKNTGTGESFAQGDLVYHDASTHLATASATGNDLAGAATAAASTSDAEVWMMLGPPC